MLFQILIKAHVHSLRKHEILRSKQLISLLFKSGKSVKGDFLRIVYASFRPENRFFQEVPAILFAVSKKTLSSAVSRNRVKRMMREAYRLEKPLQKIETECQQNVVPVQMPCIALLYLGRRETLPDLPAFREEIRGLMENMICS